MHRWRDRRSRPPSGGGFSRDGPQRRQQYEAVSEITQERMRVVHQPAPDSHAADGVYDGAPLLAPPSFPHLPKVRRGLDPAREASSFFAPSHPQTAVRFGQEARFRELLLDPLLHLRFVCPLRVRAELRV